MKIMEMVNNRDMRTYLLSMKTPDGKVNHGINCSELLRFCRQIASGMNYISNMSCIHRDLAAKNVLLSEEKVCKVELLF